MDAFEAGGLTPAHLTKLGQSPKVIADIKKVLDGLAEIKVTGEEIDLGNRIYVDRSIRPSYPRFVGRILYEEWEKFAPTEYDISQVKLSFCIGQSGDGKIRGSKIHATLRENNNLGICLGLRDLEEIKKKGVNFFKKHFRDQKLFAWKGVACELDGNELAAPYLCVNNYHDIGERIEVYWCGLSLKEWDMYCPAAYFAI